MSERDRGYSGFTSERIRRIDARERWLTGNGDPNAVVTAAESVYYWDYTNNNLYVNNDSATGWTLIGGGGGAIPHNLLNGVVHPDTVAQGATRGSLIYGNATPAWDELVHPGADRILNSNATDVLWTTHLEWSEANDVMTITPQAAGGITFAGATTFNRIRVPDNIANALYVDDAGTLEYIKIISTNADPQLVFDSVGNGCDVYSPGTGANSTKYGLGAAAAAVKTTAVGNAVTVTAGDDSVAFGSDLVVSAAAAGAFGHGYTVSGQKTFAFGWNCSPGAFTNGVAFGTQATLTGNQGTAVGALSSAGSQGVSIGETAVSSNASSVAIGRGSTSSGIVSIALGPNITASATAAIGIGYNFIVATANAAIIGNIYSDTYYVNIGSGVLAPLAKLHLAKQDTATNTLLEMARYDRYTSNTAAALFGQRHTHWLEDSAGNIQAASENVTLWAVATSGSESPLLRRSTYPEGTVGPGYDGLWTWSDLDNTARTVIPNGTGDAAAGVNVDYRIAESGGDFYSGSASCDVSSSVELYNDGVDIFTLAVAADGSVTVQRTAGASTANIVITGIWLT